MNLFSEMRKPMSEPSSIEDIDYGPLSVLVGVWTGDRGMDIAPEADGTEENPYFETISIEAVGDVTNAEEQTIAALRYHQVVSRKSNKKVFHNQTGYWMWDADRQLVMQSLTIPRSVCLLAGGVFEATEPPTPVRLQVRAAIDNSDWSIVQSPFMQEKARTVEFSHEVSVIGETMTYSETTLVEIYGKRVDHTDTNTLIRSD